MIVTAWNLLGGAPYVPTIFAKNVLMMTMEKERATTTSELGVTMKRYKVAVFITLDEYEIGTTHHHKAMARVQEFEDSKLTAEQRFDFLEREILRLLATAATQS